MRERAQRTNRWRDPRRLDSGHNCPYRPDHNYPYRPGHNCPYRPGHDCPYRPGHDCPSRPGHSPATHVGLACARDDRRRGDQSDR